MKKTIYILVTLLSMFVIVSCNKKDIEKLDTPKNLVVNKNSISFDAVLNATSYILRVNDDEITINNTTYTFTEEGTYTVSVKAVSKDYLDSDYSTPTIVVVKFLKYPQYINIVDKKLVFTEIDDADGYVIEVNGIAYDSIDKIPEFEDGKYSIRIKAVSTIYIDSDFSPITNIEVTSKDIVFNHHYRYSKYSNFHLPLYTYTSEFDILNPVLTIEKDETIETVDISKYYIINQTVYLSSEYIKSLITNNPEIKRYDLVLDTNLGRHFIRLDINELQRPYGYSDISVKSDGTKDVIFSFEMFNYEFNQVIGQEITEVDYSFYSNRLIINREYINKLFETKNEFTISALFYDEDGNSTLIILLISKK